jgi:hypothetical protein
MPRGSFHRAKTHCAAGHPYSGDNLVIRTRKVKGGKTCVTRCCRACERAWIKNGSLSLEQMRKVVEAVREGETIHSITQKKRLVMFYPLHNFLNDNPKLRSLIMTQAKKNAAEVSKAAGARKRKPTRFKAGKRALAAIEASVPRSLPKHMRDDVVADMALAISMRYLRIKDVAARADEFRRAHNRRFNSFEVMPVKEEIFADDQDWLLV